MTEDVGATAYTSTVVAPVQIALGVGSGLVLALVLLLIEIDLWPVAIIGLIVTSVTGYYLATVTLSVSRSRVTIGQGRFERSPRVLDPGDVTAAEARTLSWPQCFGIGVRAAARTTRLSVRAGPTLCLTLRDGELIRVSTPDPETALLALGRSHP